MSSQTEAFDDTILSHLDGDFTPQAAQSILSIGFSEAQQSRMKELAGKARLGELSSNERAEADSFERVSSLLGILQSKARRAMQESIK